MRKQLILVLGLLGFFIFTPLVSAEENSIESIHIVIELHEDGSATIHENRKMRTYEHTEVYIVLENLQDSQLLNFEVEGFNEEEAWNVENSFEEKANQYGVIDTGEGYELVWGISEYGDPVYNISYRLSNLVRKLDDGQAMLWNFDTFSMFETDRLTLEIQAPFPLEDELIDYYGFGFEGPIEITNGTLTWTGYGLDEGNDATVLLQFPADTFQTSVSVDQTLAEQREMALEGSSYNETEPMPLWLKIFLSTIGAIFGIGTIGGIGLAIQNQQVKKEHHHFFPTTYIKENRGKLSMNPPIFEGDIGYYAAFIKQVVYGGGGFSEYLFFYFILWTLEEKVSIKTRNIDRKLFGSAEEANMFIQNYEMEQEMNSLSFQQHIACFKKGESTLEEVFWAMVLEIAYPDGHVNGEEVQAWSEENAEEVYELTTTLDKVSKQWLEANDYLVLSTVSTKPFPVKVEALTEKGEEFVTSIIKFDNFIKEMKEVPLTEFDNWHELILWAALFGKAEDTVQYLEEFHPQTWMHLQEAYPAIYGNYYAYQYFYITSSKGLSAGGYSSSGSGFSSVGGGGGAGGGGGGGSR